MNLPLVVEMTIALIFLYLILSLLTSEIQELITILLQWRAEHLKKSIETLIAGEPNADPLYQKFTDELYNHPLIRSLNQEAKGKIAVFFRHITYSIFTLYRTLTRTRNPFGQQKSAPSYIPAQTFAIALLQQSEITRLHQKISEITLKKFCNDTLDRLEEILDDLQNSLGNDVLLIGEGSVLEREFRLLEEDLEAIVDHAIAGDLPLSNSLEQIAAQLARFTENTQALLGSDHHCKIIVRQRLVYFQQTIARRQFQPTMTAVLRLVFDEESRDRPASPWLRETIAKLHKEAPDLMQQAANIPYPLRQTLLCLAEQATRATRQENELHHLETEVAHWFSRSMERASGVYRRNAKGVAVLIGILLAIGINADTFYLVDRLAREALSRPTLTQAGSASPTGVANVQPVRLPLGWNRANVRQQDAESKGWTIPLLRLLLGWLITGIALSMGASFWYDTLGRIMRVRRTGKTPNL